MHTIRIVLASLLLIAGCSSNKNAEGPLDESDRTPNDLSRMLPLKDRTVSNFRTESELGDGVLVLEYFRPRQDHAEIRLAGSVEHLRVSKERVARATGGTLLELPLLKDATFSGSFGTVTIQEVDQSITVPAGTFKGCLTTLEESKAPPKRGTSVYCPDVGLVRYTIETFGEAESSSLFTELKYHGPRVDLTR